MQYIIREPVIFILVETAGLSKVEISFVVFVTMVNVGNYWSQPSQLPSSYPEDL